DILSTLQNVFGHSQFLEGQETVLQRVLAGESTLFVSATGGGKSLCFQLPSCHLKGSILVISPLLSLIQDQLEHMPGGVAAATLNSTQSYEEYQRVVEGLRAGKIDILFIAPERLMTDSFLSLASFLPPFSLACVDEAHCLSEWAHNFRPSYSRLNMLIRQHLKIPTILALTATATKVMERDIRDALSIPEEGTVRVGIVRPNLFLSVSREQSKRSALVQLLREDKCFSKGSVIVYCQLRSECEEVAKLLSYHKLSADFYHAGRPHKDRQRVQNKFFDGKLRIVVATVAFGMGIDKRDVQGVIHFSCPDSIESYVQEIGRAGRDGREAFCHLFYDFDDFERKKSYAYSDGIERMNV
ncbi:RecQL4 DNA/RNA helicase, partial [Guillardia theta CCMP2712]